MTLLLDLQPPEELDAFLLFISWLVCKATLVGAAGFWEELRRLSRACLSSTVSRATPCLLSRLDHWWQMPPKDEGSSGRPRRAGWVCLCENVSFLGDFDHSSSFLVLPAPE